MLLDTSLRLQLPSQIPFVSRGVQTNGILDNELAMSISRLVERRQEVVSTRDVDGIRVFESTLRTTEALPWPGQESFNRNGKRLSITCHPPSSHNICHASLSTSPTYHSQVHHFGNSLSISPHLRAPTAAPSASVGAGSASIGQPCTWSSSKRKISALIALSSSLCPCPPTHDGVLFPERAAFKPASPPSSPS